MPFVVDAPTPTDLEEFPSDLPTRAYLGDSGIVFGGDLDVFGCRWKWAPTNAWGAKPAPREQVGDRALGHGQWDATQFYGPRVTPIAGTVHAPDHAALHAAEQRLRDAVALSGMTLRITEPGFDGFAVVRQQGEILWTENSHQHASFSVNLFASDPFIYSSLLRSFSLAFPARSGGLVWPATWPTTWDATSTSGAVTITNPSSRWALALQARVSGPVDDFTIANPDTGQALTVRNPDGPTLNAGEFMLIDTGRRSVLLNGDGGRRSWARGAWPLLPPGSSTLAIASSNAGDGAQLYGEYRAVRV